LIVKYRLREGGASPNSANDLKQKFRLRASTVSSSALADSDEFIKRLSV